MSSSKRDFGSFHSSNVQELLNIPEEEYVPPELPFSCNGFKDYAHNKPVFGKEVRRKHFFLEDECVFLNHGAFGCVLKEAMEISQKYQRWTEGQPLRFYDRELLPRLVHVTRRLAKFVGCDPRDMVLVENATTALNCIIQGIPLTAGDTVFCLSITYGAVKKMLRWACERSGATLQEVTVDFPIKNKEQIISTIKENLTEGTKFAVFDHIPSNTPFIMPIKEIVQVCRARNVKIIIDGAHGLGSLPLDLQALDQDFYVTNGHKWFCCPKGTAFMYVKKELQPLTRPLIISHGFGSGFNSEFIWAGLHDYSPFLAIHTVLDFWETVGKETILSYMHDLCHEAGKLLCDGWGTSLAAPADMFGTMCLVELPDSVYKKDTKVDYSSAEKIQNRLYHEHNIEEEAYTRHPSTLVSNRYVPVKCIQEKLFVRISCHLHNHIEQYETLRDAVLNMM